MMLMAEMAEKSRTGWSSLSYIVNCYIYNFNFYRSFDTTFKPLCFIYISRRRPNLHRNVVIVFFYLNYIARTSRHVYLFISLVLFLYFIRLCWSVNFVLWSVPFAAPRHRRSNTKSQDFLSSSRTPLKAHV